YERAAVTIEPLTRQYPRNGIFNLFLGNFNLELNRKEKAVASLRAVVDQACCEISCGARVRALANSLLATVR
ncbi:MAG: hypothetical protein WB995_17150, partial [Candidatus Acidiferrales bacterium]